MATQAERAKLAAALKPKKRSKYGNKRTVVDGVKFDSSKESRRWSELKILERAGEIIGLKRQVDFPLYAMGGELVGFYIADAVYYQDGKKVVEDTKGVRTDVYKWKKRHMKAQNGIDIKET